MQKLFFFTLMLISNLFFSQNFERRTKYLDSIVSKADTIFIVFTKEINFVQSEVPIYDFQIKKEKLKNSIQYDTLNDGRLIYKNLPQEFDRKQNENIEIYAKEKDSAIFENNELKVYNKRNNTNNKIVGYEKRICLNNDNRIYQNSCSIDLNYKYVFYHSYIQPKFQSKYIDYTKYRDSHHKTYDVRYSGFSPNFESGAIGFTGTKIFSIKNNNLLFFIDTYYENIRGVQNKRITLPYLEAILKEGKIYFIKTSTNIDNKEQVFEEVKYQKFVTDA